MNHPSETTACKVVHIPIGESSRVSVGTMSPSDPQFCDCCKGPMLPDADDDVIGECTECDQHFCRWCREKRHVCLPACRECHIRLSAGDACYEKESDSDFYCINCYSKAMECLESEAAAKFDAALERCTL